MRHACCAGSTTPACTRTRRCSARRFPTRRARRPSPTEYEQIIERLVAEKLKANVALKLTHLGLGFDVEVAYANVERLVARAGELGTFLRIDMEQSDYVE